MAEKGELARVYSLSHLNAQELVSVVQVLVGTWELVKSLSSSSTALLRHILTVNIAYLHPVSHSCRSDIFGEFLMAVMKFIMLPPI